MRIKIFDNILPLIILRGYITGIFLLLNVMLSNAQIASPQLTCLEVNADGTVTLNWIPASNTDGSFEYYTIYSNSSGTFSAVTTINTVTTSVFTDNIANGLLNTVSYYISTSYQSGGNTLEAPQSDTLSTIYLNLSNPTNGTAILQWNDPVSNLIAGDGFGHFYYIWQEFPTGNWQIIDSVDINAVNYFRDTISICSAFINYRISLSHNNGCSFLSNLDGDQFNDMIAPYSPIIQNVSVDSTTGNAVIDWYPSLSNDAVAYIILTNISGGWVIIDTVFGHNNTSYSYASSNADLISEQFGISAFDSCWRGNPLAPNTSPMGTSHRSIYLRNTYKVCEPSIELKWNRYINWSSGVHHYEIYRKLENSSYQLLTQQVDFDTIFLDESISYNTNYCYLIRAISGDLRDTAISNIICRYSSRPSIPNFSYLSYASVLDEQSIEIGLHTHTGGITKEIILERSRNEGETYQTIETLTTLQENMTFTDASVTPADNIYRYRVLLKDSCNNVSRITNIGENIIVKIQADNSNLRTQLTWTGYREWQQGVINYEIYRNVGGLNNYELIATLNGTQLFYEDDVSSFVGTTANGLFCYYVKAIENENSFGFSSNSYSNNVCATMQPLVFVPNALLIGGINDTWKPVVNLLNFDSYNVRVYTRFGEVIFETTDPHQAWDGRYKGQLVQLGVYIYQITFDAGNGKFEDIRGAITVVR
jgi:gliding motility-associated-like protein